MIDYLVVGVFALPMIGLTAICLACAWEMVKGDK